MKYLTTLLIALISISSTWAQSDRAVLDLEATDKGLLIPRLTQMQKIALGDSLSGIHDGLLIYNKETHEFCYWDSTQWKVISPALWKNNGPLAYYDEGPVAIGLNSPLYFDQFSVNGSAIITAGVNVGEKYSGVWTDAPVTIDDTTMFNSGNLSLYQRLTTTGSSTLEIDIPEPKIEIKARGDGPYLNPELPVRDDDSEIIMRNGRGYIGYHLDFKDSEPEFKMKDALGSNKVIIQSTQVGVDDGAILKLLRDGDTETVILDGDSFVGDGGSLQLNNSFGALRIIASAEDNISSNARIQMYDEENGLGIEMHGFEGIKVHDYSQTLRTFIDRDGDMEFRDQNGNVSVKIDSDLNGDGRVITQELEITGGSDVSEYFDITTKEKDIDLAGSLVSLDQEHIGKLKISDKAYDKNIVGVISGANGIESGIIMGQKNTIAYGAHPVALVGRVYVKATNSNGNIKPGDKLTSSKIPGIAMRATKKRKSKGAIIGMAMSTLDDKEGTVLILLTR